MTLLAPPIDQRTATEVARQLQSLLRHYAPAWNEVDPTGQPVGISAGLIGVFSRFAELVILRLNQAPDKNQLSFLGLLGASLLPPRPAQVPLTFFLAAGAANAVVPARTQVAVPPGPGVPAPLLFETIDEIALTPATPGRVVTWNPNRDRYTWQNETVDPSNGVSTVLFNGTRVVDHVFFIGLDELLGFDTIASMSVHVELTGPVPRPYDPRSVLWEIWDGTSASSLSLRGGERPPDGTAELTQTGDVYFDTIASVPRATVGGITSRWLRCQLLGPQVPPDASFVDTALVDTSRDFYPFGSTPGTNAIWYLGCREVFIRAEFRISVMLAVFNPGASNVVDPSPDTRILWEYWDGNAWTSLGALTPGAPIQYNGSEFTGDTSVFSPTGSYSMGTHVSFVFPTAPAPTTVNGVSNLWIRVRIVAGHFTRRRDATTPDMPHLAMASLSYGARLSRSDTAVSKQIRQTQLPTIRTITVQGLGASNVVLPDASFVGVMPLDASRDFNPFGADAKFGATWYLASRRVFSQAGRRITISAGVSTTPPIDATATLQIAWEYFNGASWVLLGTQGPRDLVASGGSGLTGNSLGFTSTGYVFFTIPTQPHAVVVNGIENYWIRARIASPGWAPRTGGAPPASPMLSGVSLSFDTGNITNRVWNPDAVVTWDGYQTIVQKEAFQAFAPAVERGETLYLGFTLPPGVGTFPQWPVSLYVELESLPFGATPYNAAPSAAPQLLWNYFNGSFWDLLVVDDGTEALTGSGIITFLPPVDFTPTTVFGGGPMYWLRIVWAAGDYKFLPRLRRVLLNTGMGEQAVTVRNEVLGSSTGEAAQVFTAAQTPILDGVVLEVLEPDLPAAAERQTLGSDAVTTVAGGALVRWSEVGDFHGSGPRDRHFTLDHQTGSVTFGDGANGLIPPIGPGNMRLTRYRTGGGAQGNVGVGAVRQMKTTVPYVDRVTNWVDASGGIGAETLDELRARAPSMVRHGGRAVTAVDYQDMARLASFEVARCLAVPLYDLSVDPDGTKPKPGTVTTIIVPRSDALRPAPSVTLVEEVRAYLTTHAPPTADLVITGPEYIRVDVRAQLAVLSLRGAGEIEAAALAALSTFLHPLTGGADGNGWSFGREPHRSDIIAVLQSIPGVDHLRGLEITLAPDRPNTAASGRFLVCSGNHRIALVYGR